MRTKTALRLMSAAFVLSILVSYAAPVMAGNHFDKPTREEREAAREERAAEREALKEERAAARGEAQEARLAERCERIADRVATRLVRMEANRDVHVGNYTRLLERLDAMIAALDGEGLDTTDLQVARDALAAMIDEYAVVFSELLAELEALEGDPCGDSENDFKGFLQGAKDYLHELIEFRQAIRKFYRTDVRPAIKALRDEAHDSEAEVEESTDE